MKLPDRWNTAAYRAMVCVCAIALLGFGTVVQAQYNLISTVAGGGTVNGPAKGANSDLPGPQAVIQDSQGNTYFSVPNAAQVYKVDAQGKNISVFAGLGWPTEEPTNYDGKPATQASLKEPSGLAVDNNGNVYIVDTNDYDIRQVNSQGIINTVAGNSHLCGSPTSDCGDKRPARAGELNFPEGMATDSAGNLYIADTGDNRIRVVNMQSTTITIAGISIGAGDINTVAGNGVVCASPTSPCGDNGKAIAANLNSPQGVVVDSTGNIYISDSGDHRVRVVTTSGIIKAYAGNGNPCNLSQGNTCGDGGAATSATLSSPWQVSIDNSGNLYIADAPESRIRMVNSSGTISSVAGTGIAGFNKDNQPATSAELNSPRGVYISSTTGEFYIADTGNQEIRYVLSGTINGLSGRGNGNDGGPATSAILGADSDVALDSAGNLYIADTANNRIRKVAAVNGVANGTITTIAGNGTAGSYGNNVPATTANLSAPNGIAVDANANVYFSDSNNLIIRKVNTTTGIISTVAGVTGSPCTTPLLPCGDGGPATSATFGGTVQVAVDSTGNLYIADAGTNRIRAVNMQASPVVIAGVNIAPGDIATIAGTGGSCGNPQTGQCGDGGPATSALLNLPFGVAVDNSGNVYIADTYDQRVRVVNSSGTINGYAFNGTQGFGPDQVQALNSEYNTPMYVNVDPHGNLYISGSDFYYVIQRVDVYDTTIWSVAGRQGDPKYYGYLGDGGTARGAAMNNYGSAIDGQGHLYIGDGGNNRVRYVPLVPTAALSATKLQFPPTPVGQTSAGMSFNLTNNGSDDMYMSGTPQVTGPFTLTGVVGSSPANTCAKEIAPGQYCTYTLTYTPTQVGQQNGSIVITDNAANSSVQKVLLYGSGTN
jgi:sugar lactone lactonase YvrE